METDLKGTACGDKKLRRKGPVADMEKIEYGDNSTVRLGYWLNWHCETST